MKEQSVASRVLSRYRINSIAEAVDVREEKLWIQLGIRLLRNEQALEARVVMAEADTQEEREYLRDLFIRFGIDREGLEHD